MLSGKIKLEVGITGIVTGDNTAIEQRPEGGYGEVQRPEGGKDLGRWEVSRRGQLGCLMGLL